MASTETEEKTETTAKQRYTALESERTPVVERAIDAASVTIPALMPPLGHTDASSLPTPFQSVGARGVNNLAAKMLLVLFPPGSSFFRLAMDDFVVAQLAQQMGGEDTQQFQDARAEFESALSKVERAVVNKLESVGARTQLFEYLKHLITAGNGLLYVGKDSSLKFYPLTKYVVKRDLEGTVLEIVIKEEVARTALPPEARALVAGDNTSAPNGEEKNVEVYTYVCRQTNGSMKVVQEIEGQIVPGSTGTYPKDKCAFLVGRFIAVDGEDYGRGYVEEYQGDLYSLEKLSQALVEGAGMAAKHVWMVNEGGTTSKAKVAKAANGAVIDGKAEDVTVLRADKYADLQVVKATADGVELRLSKAFMLSDSVQRQAERVTAEEIRFMAGELEQALGGTYSVLAQELQRPLAVRVMHQMTVSKQIPRLPDKAVSPQVVTGLEGLGRSGDLLKLEQLISGIAQDFGPEAVAQYVNVGAFIKRKAAALNIDIQGLVRSDSEVQQQQQAAQQAEAAKAAIPAGVKVAGDAMKQQQQAAQQPAASQQA